MNIENLCQIAHTASVSKGFHNPPPSPLEAYALIISEIAEAIEAARTDKPAYYLDGHKPEGQLAELADAVIRIADYCGSKNWDLTAAITEKLEYNKSRPYKHGKLK